MIADEESARRAAVIAEARSWLKTPWHHEACVKGEGVDCAQFLIAVYSALALIPPIETEHYPPDWHLHRGEPLFLAHMLKHARRVDSALPGDVAMFGYGRAAAHGSIVVEWPTIIHAYARTGVVQLDDGTRNAELAQRFAGFYRYNGFA